MRNRGLQRKGSSQSTPLRGAVAVNGAHAVRRFLEISSEQTRSSRFTPGHCLKWIANSEGSYLLVKQIDIIESLSCVMRDGMSSFCFHVTLGSLRIGVAGGPRFRTTLLIGSNSRQNSKRTRFYPPTRRAWMKSTSNPASNLLDCL